MISFSGIDCSGKSTQIKRLREELTRRGYRCKIVWSRGGYTPGIEFIKRLIRHGKNDNKEERSVRSQRINSNPRFRKLLFIAGLIDLWSYYTLGLRAKSLKRSIVICDRYIWDTYIDYKMKYPEYDFERGFWWRLTLKTMVVPKCSFCLTIPVEESLRRSELKEEPYPEDEETRIIRINYYRELIEQNKWMYVIDAMETIDKVFLEICGKVIV